MKFHVQFTTQSLSRTAENWTWGQNNFSLCSLLTFQFLFYKSLEFKVLPGMRAKCFPSVQWWQEGNAALGKCVSRWGVPKYTTTAEKAQKLNLNPHINHIIFIYTYILYTHIHIESWNNKIARFLKVSISWKAFSHSQSWAEEGTTPSPFQKRPH